MSMPSGDNPSLDERHRADPPEVEPPVVLVLGSHRSGTSLLARVVNLCGVPMDAEEHLMGPSRDNERGYWEPRYLAEINNEILEASGGCWCDPPLDGVAVAKPSRGTEGRMRESVAARRATGGSWLWKDPRLTVTLPAWLGVLPGTVALIGVRNPLDVWHSLFRRDRFPKSVSFLLWEVYSRAALRHTLDMARTLVHYERLIDEPRQTVEAIASFLDASGVVFTRPDSLDPACEECIRGLQHHRHPPEAFFEDDAATESQKRLYEELLSAAPDRPPSEESPMTTPGPVARELFGFLHAQAAMADRARLEDERFHVLDCKLSDEVHLAGERFRVLDEKLSRVINLLEDRFRVLTDELGRQVEFASQRLETLEERLTRLTATIDLLHHHVGEMAQRRALGEVKFGSFRLGIYQECSSAKPRRSGT